MELKLKGNRFVFDDKPADIPTRTWKKQLIEAGGEYSTRVDKADVLVADSAYSKRIASAVKRGLIIITSSAFVTLITEGTLLIERLDELATESLDALLGEARSILAAQPTDEGWATLLRLIHLCSADQVTEFVTYLDAHISRWDVSSMMESGKKPATLEATANLDETAPGWWTENALGDVRVAPNEWLIEMASGIDDIRWRLVYAIDNDALELSSKSMNVVLARPDLMNLRVLRCEKRRMTASFYKMLTTHPSMKSLEHLYLGPIEPRDIQGFQQDETSLNRLQHLSFHTYWSNITPTMLMELSETQAMSQVTHLSLFRFEMEEGRHTLSEGFPKLHTLSLHGTQSWHYDEGTLPASLQRVSLGEHYWYAMDMDNDATPRIALLLDSPSFRDVPILDLEAMLVASPLDEDRRLAFFEWLMLHVNRLGSFETLVLGQMKTDAICDVIQEAYPSISIV